jgi:hypothetical protein
MEGLDHFSRQIAKVVCHLDAYGKGFARSLDDKELQGPFTH